MGYVDGPAFDRSSANYRPSRRAHRVLIHEVSELKRRRIVDCEAAWLTVKPEDEALIRAAQHDSGFHLGFQHRL
jgi:hypothetical protein